MRVCVCVCVLILDKVDYESFFVARTSGLHSVIEK